MRNKKWSFISMLLLTVSLIVCVPQIAGADQSERRILQGEFVTKDGLAVKYSDITAEIMQKIVADPEEDERFRAQFWKDYAAQVPNAMPMVEYTEEQMEAFRKRQDATLKKAFSQPLQVVAPAETLELPAGHELPENTLYLNSSNTKTVMPGVQKIEIAPLPDNIRKVVEGQFVTDSGVVMKYSDITADIMNGLSASEIQKLKDQLVADIIKYHPELIQVAKYSEADIRNFNARKRAAFAQVFSQKFSLDDQVPPATMYITTDQPMIFSNANAGQALTFASVNPQAIKARWSTALNGRAYAQSDVWYPGENVVGSGGGLVGRVVTIKGSGTRTADVDIKGAYDVVLQIVGNSNNLSALAASKLGIDFFICEFDPTTAKIGKQLASINLFTPTHMTTVLPNQFIGELSSRLNVTLEAGKSYIFAIGVYTEAGVRAHDGIAFAAADAYSDSDSNACSVGVDFTSVAINWN